MRPASAKSDTRDFLMVSLFVSAFLLAGYLALWKPLLYRLS